MYQLFFNPENYHVGTHGSNIKLFLGKSFLTAEKKIKKVYEKFYKTTELVLKNKDKKKLLDYNNIFLTISTQNYIFDSMTMANSIENRSPLLDYKLFEFMSSVPKKIKNKNGLKSLYKKLLSEHLPDYITRAKKSGPNLPIKFWFDTRPELKNKTYKFIKKNNLNEHVRADTAGSAEMISKTKDKKQAAIASSLSAEIYNLDVIKKNIENESGNLTRFLVMGKNISQPEFVNKKYITSFLFKLKSKPAALYQSLGGFAINGVNLTKLQSYPEKNSFDSYFFLCDLDGHIEDPKVQKSLEELGLHCEDFHVLGVFEADILRQKKQ